ncbi:MAG: hypothetical protein J2P40_15045, partial [Candidatus Dormibacteraeota bacterium]|nr:hypothetical protein [Candidatus Dormibacteraeota bacterium]MBO0762590.1 hypothetical protein [Candidatus Dormibacteraeota bacterium]
MSNEEEARQQDPAPPGPARLQLSPDGRWWWDGLRWNPMPEDVVPPPPTGHVGSPETETDPWRTATDDHPWSPASDAGRWSPAPAQLWPPPADPQEPPAGETSPAEAEGWSAAEDDRWSPAPTQPLWPPSPEEDGFDRQEPGEPEPFRWDRPAGDDPPPAPPDPLRWDAQTGGEQEPSAPEPFHWNQQPKDWPFGGPETGPPAPPAPPPPRLEDAPSELTHLREQLRQREEIEG